MGENCFLRAALNRNILKKFRSDKKMEFSNESVKKPTIYDLLFIVAIFIVFKMSTNLL